MSNPKFNAFVRLTHHCRLWDRVRSSDRCIFQHGPPWIPWDCGPPISITQAEGIITARFHSDENISIFRVSRAFVQWPGKYCAYALAPRISAISYNLTMVYRFDKTRQNIWNLTFIARMHEHRFMGKCYTNITTTDDLGTFMCLRLYGYPFLGQGTLYSF